MLGKFLLIVAVECGSDTDYSSSSETCGTGAYWVVTLLEDDISAATTFDE